MPLGKAVANILLGMALALFIATIFLFVMDSQFTLTFLAMSLILFLGAWLTSRKSA